MANPATSSKKTCPHPNPSDNRTLEWVRAGDLEIDTDYQRDYNENHGRRLTGEFDTRRLGAITVFRRLDGSMWIVEGQHRWRTALDLFGEDYLLPALVISHGTREDEAFAWGANKRHKGTRGHEEHKADVMAEDPTAMEIEKILHNEGLDVGGSSGAYRIQGVKAIYEIHEQYGAGMLTAVLQIMPKAFGYDKKTWTASIMVGVAKFLSIYPSANHDQVAKALTRAVPKGRDVTATEVMHSMKRIVDTEKAKDPSAKNKADVTTALCDVLFTQYNFRYSKKLKKVVV